MFICLRLDRGNRYLLSETLITAIISIKWVGERISLAMYWAHTETTIGILQTLPLMTRHFVPLVEICEKDTKIVLNNTYLQNVYEWIHNYTLISVSLNITIKQLLRAKLLITIRRSYCILTSMQRISMKTL